MTKTNKTTWFLIWDLYDHVLCESLFKGKAAQENWVEINEGKLINLKSELTINSYGTVLQSQKSKMLSC